MWLYLHLWTIKLALGRSLWQPLISELALSDFKVVSATDDATYLQLNTKSQELQMLSTCCRFCDSHNFPCYEPLQSVNKYASSLNCILFAVLMPQNGILQQLKIRQRSNFCSKLNNFVFPFLKWKHISIISNSKYLFLIGYKYLK